MQLRKDEADAQAVDAADAAAAAMAAAEGADWVVLEEEASRRSKSISLAAKWAPREGKEGHELACALAKAMFPSADGKAATSMKAYRRLVAALNARLKTIETLMCAGRWADISPQAVPGRAGKLYTRALLNLVGTKRKGQELTAAQKDELRRPDDADRMSCRARFEEHFARAKEGKAVVHGADTLFPHEVVKHARNDGPSLSEGERSQLVAVWRSMVEKAKAGGGLKRTIFMSDFSGSMQSSQQGDIPYWVSVGLGMLGAEVSEGAFHNKLMTFDSTPKWHTFPEGADLFARLDTLTSGVGQGTSTDFQAAMDLVLATLKASRTRPGEEPENLVVLTDMGWDQACASNQRGVYTGNAYRHHVKTDPWQTHVEMIRESFRRAGEDMWGEGQGFTMPRIVIWNLASSYSSDMHATAETPGVALLSGWSPALFEVLQADGPRELTPLEVLRIELSHPRYECVRARVRAVVAAEEAAAASAGGGGGGGGVGGAGGAGDAGGSDGGPGAEEEGAGEEA
jgi:hypothetical protein